MNMNRQSINSFQYNTPTVTLDGHTGTLRKKFFCVYIQELKGWGTILNAVSREKK